MDCTIRFGENINLSAPRRSPHSQLSIDICFVTIGALNKELCFTQHTATLASISVGIKPMTERQYGLTDSDIPVPSMFRFQGSGRIKWIFMSNYMVYQDSVAYNLSLPFELLKIGWNSGLLHGL